MAHGLEVRTPLTDVKFFEFALGIPWQRNLRQGETGHWQGKRILKKVLAKYYPKDFVHRPKKGFAVPLRKWFSAGGELHAVLHERLLDPDSDLFTYFEPAVLRRFIEVNATGPLWLLLFLDEWLRQNGG
jgi:asparagine synthase (glutamine-hydrolysing)